ncbi:hypothetical protein Tco_0445717, partial [Tanacetum coccineum]
ICPRVHGQNFDELPTDEDIVSFFKELGHTREIKSLSGKTTGLEKLCLSRAQILWGMYYKKNVDYVELLWEDFTYQIDNKVSLEEPTRKSKRVKRPAKKSTNVPIVGVVIRETPVMSLSKKKEKVTVKKCKGINFLSEVALSEEAQYEEVHKKSLRDFHNTHPSGSGIVTKITPSATKIIPSFINEGTSAKPGVPDVTEEESTESEAESWGRDEDDKNNDHDSISEGNDQDSDSEDEKDDELVKTPSNSTNNEDETNVEDKAEVNTDEGLIQKEGTDAEMINIQQGNENPEITINQVIEDAHVTISTIPKKTEVLVTSSSHSSDLASKFLKNLDIPPYRCKNYFTNICSCPS